MSGEDSSSSTELCPGILHPMIGSAQENGPMCNGTANGKPYLQIIEQPKSRGFRFRYACEGTSHGGIQGEHSGKSKKSFPTVQIHNYSGRARVLVKLVTDEINPRPHAHELIGKNCKEGNCSVDVNFAQNNGIVSFPNMGILHVTRKNVNHILKTRIMEEMKVSKVMNDPLQQLDLHNIQLTSEEEKCAVEQATAQGKDMSLNKVRLCFQAYLADSRGGYSHILPPVYSKPIYDCKSPGAAALKICRMDKQAGCCTGNEEVFLLCDKVQKDDITVRFFEVNEDSEVTWEAQGNFGPTDVHRQYAIVFRTPQYCNTDINRPVSVHVQLRRSTDGETSDAKPFTFYPQQKDQDEVLPKKQKAIPCVGMNGSVFSLGAPVNQNPADTITLVNPQVNGVNTVREGVPFTGGSTFIIHGNVFSNGNGLNKNHPNQAVFMNQAQTENMGQAHQVRLLPQGINQSQNIQHMQGKGAAPADPVQQLKMQSRGAFGSGMRSKKAIILERNQGKKADLEEDSSPCLDEVDSARHSCMSFDQDSGIGMFSHTASVIAKPAGSACSVSQSFSKLTLGNDPEVMDKKQQLESAATDLDSGVVELPSEKSQEKEEVTTKDVPDVVISNVAKKTATENEEETSQVEVKKESTTEPPVEDIQELAWRVAENTAIAMQEFAKTGNIAYLLLIQRHLVAVQDSNGDTALHLAVIHHKVEPLRSLLCVASTLPENPAINTYNSLQQTPLHLAVITNQPDMVEILVSNHADLSIVDRNGNTPIHLAASLGYAGCLKNLICTSKGSTLETRKLLKSLNYDGFAAVHLSVREGHMTCLRHLVTADADVNVPDGKSGYTALHHATDCENLGIVGYLLLEAAAEPNCPAYNGVSALHVAVGRGSLPIAALLIASGADQEAECSELPGEDCYYKEGEKEDKSEEVKGMTPLDMAVGNEKMLAVLHGEVYTSVVESPVGEEMTSPLYSVVLDSGLGFMAQDAGDLEMLDLVTRMKLSRLLDQADKSSNWEVLAHHFNLDKLCEALSSMKSPTRSLLDNLEVLDGTVSKLKEALTKMGRTDCIEVIDEGLALTRQAAHDLVEKRKKEADIASFPGVQKR